MEWTGLAVSRGSHGQLSFRFSTFFVTCASYSPCELCCFCICASWLLCFIADAARHVDTFPLTFVLFSFFFFFFSFFFFFFSALIRSKQKEEESFPSQLKTSLIADSETWLNMQKKRSWSEEKELNWTVVAVAVAVVVRRGRATMIPTVIISTPRNKFNISSPFLHKAATTTTKTTGAQDAPRSIAMVHCIHRDHCFTRLLLILLTLFF